MREVDDLAGIARDHGAGIRDGQYAKQVEALAPGAVAPGITPATGEIGAGERREIGADPSTERNLKEDNENSDERPWPQLMPLCVLRFGRYGTLPQPPQQGQHRHAAEQVAAVALQPLLHDSRQEPRRGAGAARMDGQSLRPAKPAA